MSYHKVAKADYLTGPQGFKLFTSLSRDEYKLNIKSLTVNYTYHFSSIIKGLPNDQINIETCTSIINNLEKTNIYSLPIQVAPFSYISFNDGNNLNRRIPFMFYVAELESDGINDESGFSSLIYVGFHDEISFDKFESIVNEDMMLLDWEQVAKNWDP
jgi:hypothetical protein